MRVSMLLLAACAALAGCSGGPVQVDVSGTVTLDDQVVKTGKIRFDPVDGKTASAEEFITDGKYTAKLTVGDYKVQINSSRPTGKKANRPAGPGQDVEQMEEIIPARYNSATELSIAVTKDKKEYSFPLKTAK